MHPFGSRTALIGSTGFVGSNLASRHVFTDHFHSRNIDGIADRTYDTVICAGVSAVKYLANREPEADWAAITRLLEPLKRVKARRFILISTIDVYARPVQVTEEDPPPEENHAYGRHRLAVEKFVKSHFSCHHIVRLPGLFGPGLKKNVLFDLLHRNCLENIQPASSYQYYDVGRLAEDLEKTVDLDLPLLNLATAPLTTQSILDRFAPDSKVGDHAGPAGHYDFRSLHAETWGGTDGYLYSAGQVMADLSCFFNNPPAASSPP